MENSIILPAHHKPALPCPSWKFIADEARELRAFMQRGEFIGYYQSAFAISHAQVSHAPLHFFVVNEQYDKGSLVRQFGSWCIMNLKITQFGDPISWQEACMSFPYRKPRRVDRMSHITTEYYIPFLGTWRKMEKEFKNLPAFISQHENEHAAGKNIYGI